MVFIRDRQANEQVPPVVHQGHLASHALTGLKLSGDKAAPDPLVFHLIEVILTIGAVAVVAHVTAADIY